MSYTTYFTARNSIFVREFEGEISFDEITNSWNEFIELCKTKPGIKGVIQDFRKARIHANFDNINEIMSFFKDNNAIFSQLKISIITHNPLNIVFPIYAKEKFPMFKIEPFSTSEAAIDWILMTENT